MLSQHQFRRPDLEERLSGVIVPVITPFYNGQIDTNSMNKLANFLVNSGVHGLFFLGHTGEFEYLSMVQKKQVIDIATRLEAGKTKVFVGTTCETIEETIELTRYSRQKGVDAVVIAPKYKTNLSTFDYLKRVLDESRGQVILYNNPTITDGKNIETEDLRRLLEIPKYKKRIIGIKDSSANSQYFAQLLGLRNRSHPQMAVFQGSESAMLDAPPIRDELLRADGIVAGSGNYDPKLLLDVNNTFRNRGEVSPLSSRRLRSYITEYDKQGGPIFVIKNRLALGYKISRSSPGSRIDMGYDEINPKIISSAELAPRKAA